MEALLNADLPGQCVKVVSDNECAKGLDIARSKRVPIETVFYDKHTPRSFFNQQLLQCLLDIDPDYLFLAGFMKILDEKIVSTFEGRIINIHPSLLPLFPGIKTHEKAIEHGVKVHGCTIHFVNQHLDEGPMIAQAFVPVFPDDTPEKLASRVLIKEHELYPEVAKWILKKEIIWEEGKTVISDAIKSRLSSLSGEIQ